MLAEAQRARYEVIADRREAIAAAIAAARAGDVVLIAGKGHEDYQEIAGRRSCRFPIAARRGGARERWKR